MEVGSLYAGQPVDRAVRVRNPYDQELRLAYSGSSCSCVRFPAPRVVVPAGGEVDVRYTIDTTARRGAFDLSSVFAAERGSDQGAAVVRFRGTIQPLFVATAPSEVETGPESHTRVTIRVESDLIDGTAVRLDRVDLPPQLTSLRATSPPPAPPHPAGAKAHDLTLTAEAGRALGSGVAHVWLKGTARDGSVVEYPVSIKVLVTDPLFPTPAIQFGLLNATEIDPTNPPEQTIVVQRLLRSAADVEVTPRCQCFTLRRIVPDPASGRTNIIIGFDPNRIPATGLHNSLVEVTLRAANEPARVRLITCSAVIISRR